MDVKFLLSGYGLGGVSSRVLLAYRPFAYKSRSLSSFFLRSTVHCGTRLLNGACYFILSSRPGAVIYVFALSGSDVEMSIVPGGHNHGLSRSVPERGQVHECPTMLVKELKVGISFHRRNVNSRLLSFVGS